MHEVQARGFLGESFLEKVLWDLWIMRKYDKLGYITGVLDLATIDTPDEIQKKMKIDLGEKIDTTKKELDYFKTLRQHLNTIAQKKAETIEEERVQMRNAREIEHALVNAYFEAGFLFRREEFRQRQF